MADLPFELTAPEQGMPLGHALGVRSMIEAELKRAGGVLLRDFGVGGAGEFKAFAAGFGHELLDYEFGSTPRTELERGVYTSTEYPAHQHIPLHNEQSYARTWPMKIWFYCAVAPLQAGETPIADSRRIYRQLDPALVRRLEARGLRYVRNYGGGLDVPWQKVFATENPHEVEAFCSAQGISCEWKPDGELRTAQVCQVSATHPETGERVWFNQAHLFHVSGLTRETREALLEVVESEDLPRNVYYGDGGAIEDAVLEEIRGVLAECEVVFRWREGDVLMLDNMLVAHARRPFSGPRRVIVAMAEPYSLEKDAR